MDTPGLDTAQIKVSDFVDMLKRPVGKNMKPYDKIVIESNNEEVEKFRASVLNYVADGQGMLHAMSAYQYWELYDSYKVIKNHTYKKYEPSAEDLAFWSEAFEKLNIEELLTFDRTDLLYGLRIIEDYLLFWRYSELHKRVFLSDNVIIWISLARKERDLIARTEMGLWNPEKYKEIMEKVFTILKNPITVAR